MTLRGRFVQFFLFSLIMSTIYADYKNTMRLCGIECKVSPKIAKGVNCSVKALSRTRTTLNVATYIIVPLDDVLINMQIYRKNNVRYLPYMVNVTVNICKFLAGDTQSFYARIMMDWVKHYSNVNHSCPYEGLLFVIGLEPFAENIPVFVPSGDYRLDLNFYWSTFKNWIGLVRGYGTVKTKPLFTEQ